MHKMDIAGRMGKRVVFLAALVIWAGGWPWAAPVELTLNPYRGVDWERAGRYRANMHTHTTVSDGKLNPDQVVDLYHKRGYEVLAITDHNAVSYPWDRFDALKPSAKSEDRLKKGELETKDFKYENRDPGALGMLAISGNELSRHLHTLTWFTDFNSASRDLDEVLGGVEGKGGLAAMCHPAWHWQKTPGTAPSLRTALRPALRGITQGDFTVEVWFRTRKAGRGILMGNYSAGYAGALNLELQTENRVRAYVQPGDGGRRVDLNASGDGLGIDTRDGQWHHLAMVRGGGRVFLYLDGRVAGESADTAGAFDLQGDYYYIGRDSRTGSTAFQGDLDMIRLWSRALSGEQVGASAGGSTVSREGLLVAYGFEAGGASLLPGGATVEDSAGHAGGPFHAVVASPASAGIGVGSDVAKALAGVSKQAIQIPDLPAPTDLPESVVEQYIGTYRKHSALVAIEVANGTVSDKDYPYDRELWDRMLGALMPARPVWGLAVDDMHSGSAAERGWLVFPAARLDEGKVREALVDGAFYFSSIRRDSERTGTASQIPRIDGIAHDAKAGRIVLRASVGGKAVADAACIWVGDGGKTVHTGLSIDYRAVDGIRNYVRAEITGEGGKTFTNPFGFAAAAKP